MPKSNSFAAYYSHKFGSAKGNFDSKGDDYVARVDDEQLVSYYYDQYSLPEIILKDSGKPQINAESPSMSHDDSTSVRTTVRFDAEDCPRIDETLRIGSKQFLIAPFSVDEIGFYLKVSLSPSNAEQLLNTYKQQIASIVASTNSAVQAGNNELHKKLADEVHSRKERLASQVALLKRLSEKIPIVVKTNTTSPIVPLEKKKLIPINAPKPKLSVQPKVDSKILSAILDVIIRGGLLFESAPETFSKLDEEDLRNILISILNGNFEVRAVAEAFNKLGKADISLPYSGDNLFVAECKFWDGEEMYAKTITQLFRYLRWRENLGVIICFSTKRDFTSILEKCRQATIQHNSYVADSLRIRDQKGTYYTSKHINPDDKNVLIDIHHLVFTLYFDKTIVGLAT